MSVRPQPITSQFYPDAYTFGWGDILGPSSALRDFLGSRGCSSRTSTESLTSILYHDSFSEESDSKDEEGSEEPVKESSAHRLLHVKTEQLQQQRQRQHSESADSSGARPRIKAALPEEAKHPKQAAKRKIARRRQSPSQTSVAERSPRPASQQQQQQSQRSKTDSTATDQSQRSRLTSTSSSSFSNSRQRRSSSAASSQQQQQQQQRQQDRQGKLTWEDWFLQKERELRKQKLEELQLQQKKEESEVRKRLEKQEKASKVEEVVHDWLKQKSQQRKLQRQREEEQRREKAEKEKADKEKVQERAKREYKKWLTDYKQKLTKQQEEEQRKKEAEEEQKKQQKAKSDAKVAEWQQKHKSHRMHKPYSYGYTDGKLMTYFDKNSNPPPSFVNSEPWMPPAEVLKRRSS